MSNPDSHHIDDYLLQRMKGEELAAFERRLAENPALAEAVRQQKLAMQVLDSMGDLRMKERVAKLHQQALAQQPAPRRLWAVRISIAASLALLLGLSVWLWLRPASPAQLYAAYYQPYKLGLGSRNTDADQLLAAAAKQYATGDFAAALPGFQSAMAANPSDLKLRLATGICQLELGQYDEALSNFQRIVDANDPLYTEQAQWYSAMTQLRRNDPQAAKASLATIASSPGNYFAEKAKTILAELE